MHWHAAGRPATLPAPERAMHIHQINLQPAVGGGEVYTRWFTRALNAAGATITLHVDPANRFWDGLAKDGIAVVPANDASSIVDQLPRRGAVVLTQSRLPDELVDRFSADHLLTGFSHMPILGRSAAEFTRYSTVFTVSDYCIGLLRKAGIPQVYPEPLYGTYELDRGRPPREGQRVVANSPYHWDNRKGRDRLLSIVEPIWRASMSRAKFSRRPGISLGVVSLLSPIKQFPLLFSLLGPVIVRHPGVNLEIFGNGGYAQVRDLRRSLAVLGDRVRFWGYQPAVESVYPELDYLMTGLPEKEALGLNVLEAQAAGTPVLAPHAPPFTETMVDGASGFFYPDPRQDGATGFAGLLDALVAGRPRPDPRSAISHLAKFSFGAMVERARKVLEHLRQAQGIAP